MRSLEVYLENNGYSGWDFILDGGSFQEYLKKNRARIYWENEGTLIKEYPFIIKLKVDTYTNLGYIEIHEDGTYTPEPPWISWQVRYTDELIHLIFKPFEL